MIKFTATLHQFGEKGEKTGWTYIEVPADIAEQLNPGNKKSFRVKGKLDTFAISRVALMPMGGGKFIMAVNAEMRKGIKKKKGATVQVQLSVDKEPIPVPPGFTESLDDEPKAKSFFEKLPLSHRNYFIKWISSVKGEVPMAKRMAQVITALSRQQNFGEMVRSHKANREKLGY